MHFADYFNYLLLILFTFAMIYPFIYIFSISVSDGLAIARGAVWLWPIGFDLDIYTAVFETDLILGAFRNSIIYTALGVLLTLIFCTLGGYVFSERRFRWRGPLSLLLGFTLFFSAGLIPTFLTYNSYGLKNTVWVMALPFAFNMWYIILIRTNIQSIPQELKDAARADGASDFRVLVQIVVPLIVPILATIALFTAVSRWNDFYTALVYLDESDMMPLPILLRRVLVDGVSKDLISLESMYEGLEQKAYFRRVKMATIVVTVTPILLVYPFVQRYFIKGVLVGSIKG
jgi:putative aldouronate transport system permease protein